MGQLTRPADGVDAPVLDLDAARQFLQANPLEGTVDGWLLSP